MSILKILPSAVDQTANFSFNTVNANSMFVGGIDVLNSINANTIYMQGVAATQNTWISTNTALQVGINSTQNTNITAVNTYATSAYGVANNALNNTVYTQGVDNTQNTNISLLQGAMTSANANIVQIFGITLGQNSYSQAAYSTANSAQANTVYLQGVAAGQNSFIQAAFNYANTLSGGGSSTFAGGIVSGNTIFQQNVQANGAVSIANTAGNIQYTLPNYGGTAGQSLITDGYGRLQWTTLTAINGTGGGTSTGFPVVDLGFVWENPTTLFDMGTLV